MSENKEADPYRVLGATSGDSLQHIKHRYRQLLLQVNTGATTVLSCSRMADATTQTSVPRACLFSVPPGPVQRRLLRRSRVRSEEVSGNRCSLEDLEGPGKQEAV